jgi:hypothetical protein
MKYEKTVLILVFSAGVLVGDNLDFFSHDIAKDTSSSTVIAPVEPLVATNLTEGLSFGPEPDLVADMQGCEIKAKLGCTERVICTGYAEGSSSSKIDLLMSQHKAKGVALNLAVEYTQSKPGQTVSTAFPEQDLPRYTIVGGRNFIKDNLVAVAIGYNCK